MIRVHLSAQRLIALLGLCAAIMSVTPVTGAQLYPALRAYESCQFEDGLQLVDISALGAGVSSRPVETRKGTFPLALLAGRRMMFAYPDTDFFANVKVEVLPSEHFEEEKQLALENFSFILNGNGGNLRDSKLPAQVNGFDTTGLNRPSLEGGVLGIYLLLDETNHVLTTIYFLNQEPAHRKFSSMDEYARLRTRFLETYTACIRANERNGEQK